MILLLNFKIFFENSCWVFYDFVLYSNLYRKSKNYKTCVSCDPSWGGGGGGFERSSVLSHFTSHDLNCASHFQKTSPQQQTQDTRAKHSTSHDPNNRPKTLIWICLCGIIFKSIQKIKINLFICGTSNNIIASLKTSCDTNNKT